MKFDDCKQCGYFAKGKRYCRKYFNDIAKIEKCSKKIFKISPLKTDKQMRIKKKELTYHQKLKLGFAMLNDDYGDE